MTFSLVQPWWESMFDSGHGNCTVGALNPLTEECGPRLPSACKDPQIYREFISNQNNFNHCHNWLYEENDHLAIALRRSVPHSEERIAWSCSDDEQGGYFHQNSGSGHDSKRGVNIHTPRDYYHLWSIPPGRTILPVNIVLINARDTRRKMELLLGSYTECILEYCERRPRQIEYTYCQGDRSGERMESSPDVHPKLTDFITLS